MVAPEQAHDEPKATEPGGIVPSAGAAAGVGSQMQGRTELAQAPGQLHVFHQRLRGNQVEPACEVAAKELHLVSKRHLPEQRARVVEYLDGQRASRGRLEALAKRTADYLRRSTQCLLESRQRVRGQRRVRVQHNDPGRRRHGDGGMDLIAAPDGYLSAQDGEWVGGAVQRRQIGIGARENDLGGRPGLPAQALQATPQRALGAQTGHDHAECGCIRQRPRARPEYGESGDGQVVHQREQKRRPE